MEKLIEAIKRFQVETPAAGSARMTEMIDDIVREYWNIGEVKLSDLIRERTGQIHTLWNAANIARHARKGDYLGLATTIMLYGSGFTQT